MGEEIVYVITAEHGEYSDRTNWICGVFDDERKARSLIEEKSAIERENLQKYFTWDSHYTRIRIDRGKEFCREHGILYDFHATPEQFEDFKRMVEEETSVACGFAKPETDGDTSYSLEKIRINQWQGRGQDDAT